MAVQAFELPSHLGTRDPLMDPEPVLWQLVEIKRCTLNTVEVEIDRAVCRWYTIGHLERVDVSVANVLIHQSYLMYGVLVEEVFLGWPS